MIKKPVGYLLNHAQGLSGERGVFYDYILASNGLFIEAENRLVAARIPVAECEVRGLAPLEMKVTLTYGSIPERFWDLALDAFLVDPDSEHYVAVTASAGYHFYVPVQDKSGGGVAYEVGDNVVLDLHSHGRMSAFFSPKDNADEKGLALYAVVGRLATTPVVKLRIGVYGYFETLSWKDVFDGTLAGATEYEEKEVPLEDDLQGLHPTSDGSLQHSGCRLWWDRLFRS